jgi:hypothetical protein
MNLQDSGLGARRRIGQDLCAIEQTASAELPTLFVIFVTEGNREAGRRSRMRCGDASVIVARILCGDLSIAVSSKRPWATL